MPRVLNGRTLPRGVWLEVKRKRLRVRVYRKAKVIYLEYFSPDDVDEAIAAYWAAKNQQKDLRQRNSSVAVTLPDQLEALGDVMT